MPSQKPEKITYDAIDFYKLTQKKEFSDAIKEVRKNFQIEAGSLKKTHQNWKHECKNIEEFYLWFANYHPLNEAILFIIRDPKHKLPLIYYPVIFDYIIYDKEIIESKVFKPTGFVIRTESADEFGEEKVVLELYKNTSQNEIEDRWKEIEKALKNCYGEARKKIKTPNNFMRDLAISIWVDEGLTLDEIFNLLKERGYGEVDYGSIKNAYSRFYKKYKSGKPKKLRSSRV